MSEQFNYQFATNYQQILERLNTISPEKYVKDRNYVNGHVTLLSPYISRGVISTKIVFQHLIDSGYDLKKIKKFIQELAWREYWQRIWQVKQNDINEDLKASQVIVNHCQISTAIIEAQTGIDVIDSAILALYETGYVHNHIRMYIGSIACNISKNHWHKPAQWMYYHLLDGDWASNALSWQWVAGSNANKKYFANQENINKFCNCQQRDTFLDHSYSDLVNINTPKHLLSHAHIDFHTALPETTLTKLDINKPTLLYNSYNLDPLWHTKLDANRVLLLEPSHFRQYPVSVKVMDFVIQLSKNINDLQVYVGEFKSLTDKFPNQQIIYKEHPLNQHYQGRKENRDWIFDVDGYYPSFFKFWNVCLKQSSLPL